MIYALNLADDGRVLSVTYDRFALANQPRVETLPDGDVTEYRYVDGEFVHDPPPAPEQPDDSEPTHEERITALEEALTAIEEGIASV